MIIGVWRLRTVMAAAGWGALALPALAQSTTTYTYDLHGRLTAATRSTGTSTAYAYDAADNRTQRATSVSASTPAPFNLGGPATAAPSAWANSNTITVSGITTGVPVMIAGGQYRINAGTWQTTIGAITVGQNIQVRAQAPATSGTSRTATLTIGGVTGAFQVTASAPAPTDTTPDAFNLGSPASADAGSWGVSNLVTITGINAPSPVTITGGQYRINSGAWQTAAGTILSSQTIQVRVLASASPGATQTAALSVGGVARSFSVVTSQSNPPCIPDPGQVSCTPL